MQDRSSYDYILIGIIIRAMQARDHTFEFVSRGIKDLERILTEVNLEVSIAMTQSASFLDLIEHIYERENETPNEKIDTDTIEKIINEFSGLEKVVFAESSTKKTYTIPSRRYNTEFLLNKPDKLFKNGHFEKLSELAKQDISSSSRCILFGEATASAFHILRATEDVLKNYYFYHRRQKRLPKPMWANMLEQLKAKKNNKPPKNLLDSLDMIRANYRNPTQHPEATYNIDTAQDLFGVCLDVIGKMAEEL
ncbi:hypothetical protein [Pseudoalteromonas sp. R86517]|uniref:hypothetical protein n=1 Tax=Pseudoalteromonas sp. R86517 TaxID=3093857 RepID=UPI002359D42D|nr:hypothetical protein [Pseudoalteromonas sp. Angola-31]